MKVLIVDDEQLVRRSLSRAFKLKSFEIDEAVDGKEGLEKWKSKKYDLVVLDVLMPGLSGPEVVSERGPQEDSKVILISAYSGEHSISNENQQPGIDLFIPKPFDDIFQVVDQMIKVLDVEQQ